MKLGDAEQALQLAIESTQRFFETISTLPPTEQLAHYYRLKMATASLGDQLKELNKFHHHYQYSVMPSLMVNNNIRTFTDEELGIRFGLSSRYSTKMLDRQKGFEWLRAEGQGDIITETVNAQTLGAFTGRYIQETGKDLPDDIFQVTPVMYTTTTKAKAKKRAY